MTFHKSKTFKVNPSKRFLAAEIEVALAPDNSGEIEQSVRRWKGNIEGDGSLPDSGFEIPTAPANGDKWTEQIEDICSALRSASAEVTTACGCHVHVSAEDFTYWDIRKLILFYAAVENVLFGMVPSSRRNNHFCKRCGDHYSHGLKETPKDTRKLIAKNTYGNTNTKPYRTSQKPCARYYALNLHSWFYRGTIECRLFNGTTDPEKIVNWGMLWAGILDFVHATPEGKLKELIDQHTDNGTELLLLLGCCRTEANQEWVKARYNKFNS